MEMDTCNPNIGKYKHEVRGSNSSMINASSKITSISKTPSLNNNNPIIKLQYTQMATKNLHFICDIYIYISALFYFFLEVKGQSKERCSQVLLEE